MGVTAAVNDIIEQLMVKNEECEEVLEACSFLLGQAGGKPTGGDGAEAHAIEGL